MEVNTRILVCSWKEEIKEKTKMIYELLGRKPHLAIIVAEDYSGPSSIYVNNKKKTGNELGADVTIYYLKWKDRKEQDVRNELFETIAKFNKDKCIDGIIVQLPFPYVSEEEISGRINPYKDVDGFTPYQKHLLSEGRKEALVPCTAKGVMRMIEEELEEIEGKTVVIVNRSNLIGKPLAKLALTKNMTPIICHSKSDRRLLGIGEVIVTGCGLRKNFNGLDVSSKTDLIIDCSMNKVEGIEGVGDFDKEDVIDMWPFTKIASGYGHTGPMTVVALYENLVIATQNHIKKCFNNG